MNEKKSSTNIWDAFIALIIIVFLTIVWITFALGADLTDMIWELIK